MHPSVKINLKEKQLRNSMNTRFKSVLRSIHLTVFLVAENLKIHKILHYVLKFRLLCLNNNLFLLEEGVGTWRSLYEPLSETPGLTIKTPSLSAHSSWFYWPSLFTPWGSPEDPQISSLTLVLSTTPVCTPHCQLDISPSALPPSLCLPHHSKKNFHPPGSLSQSHRSYSSFLSFLHSIH